MNTGFPLVAYEIKVNRLCWNPPNIFLKALFGLRHVMPTSPPLWHPLWSDNSREGNNNTIAKRRGGFGVIGTVPSDIGDSQFVEIYDLNRAGKSQSIDGDRSDLMGD